MNYKALDDNALQNLARLRFGSVLKPLPTIGRDAVVSELEFYDRVEELRETQSKEIKREKRQRRLRTKEIKS